MKLLLHAFVHPDEGWNIHNRRGTWRTSSAMSVTVSRLPTKKSNSKQDLPPPGTHHTTQVPPLPTAACLLRSENLRMTYSKIYDSERHGRPVMGVLVRS